MKFALHSSAAGFTSFEDKNINSTLKKSTFHAKLPKIHRLPGKVYKVRNNNLQLLQFRIKPAQSLLNAVNGWKTKSY